jgi:hypothetical protein
LTGAHLDAKFWPYAFHYFLRIKNGLSSNEHDLSSFEKLHGVKTQGGALRAFGCRVWVRPPGKRKGKLINNACKGIFLGFIPFTTKNILWYDVLSKHVKIAFHARFDEGMNDLPLALLPPNVQHLQRVHNGNPIPAEPLATLWEEAEKTQLNQFWDLGMYQSPR